MVKSRSQNRLLKSIEIYWNPLKSIELKHRFVSKKWSDLPSSDPLPVLAFVRNDDLMRCTCDFLQDRLKSTCSRADFIKMFRAESQSLHRLCRSTCQCRDKIISDMTSTTLSQRRQRRSISWVPWWRMAFWISWSRWLLGSPNIIFVSPFYINLTGTYPRLSWDSPERLTWDLLYVSLRAFTKWFATMLQALARELAIESHWMTTLNDTNNTIQVSRCDPSQILAMKRSQHDRFCQRKAWVFHKECVKVDLEGKNQILVFAFWDI